MCCHLTNINPISPKDWTLCLHMGAEWDYSVLNSCSDNIYASVPRVKKKGKKEKKRKEKNKTSPWIFFAAVQSSNVYFYKVEYRT